MPVEIVGVADGNRLHHRQTVARLDLGHAHGRLGAVQLQHVGLQCLDDFIKEGIICIDGDGNDASRGRAAGPASSAALRGVTLRGLLAKKMKPTWLAPPASAAATLSGCERPQILMSRASSVFPPRECCAALPSATQGGFPARKRGQSRIPRVEAVVSPRWA